MGDDDSSRDFVRQRLPWLSRVAFLLTGDHHHADDLVQCALVKVHARWHRLNERDHLDNYLRKVLYHEHVSLWRRSKHLQREWSVAELPEPGASDAAGDPASGSLRRPLLERALDRLTPKQRAVIVLRFLRICPKWTPLSRWAARSAR